MQRVWEIREREDSDTAILAQALDIPRDWEIKGQMHEDRRQQGQADQLDKG